MLHDFVQSAVVLELGQCIIQLLAQFIVALLVCDCVILLDKWIVQDPQGIILFYKDLRRLTVNDDCIHLALLQCLHRISTLVVRLNLGILDLRFCKDITSGTQLCANGLALQILSLKHRVRRRTAACQGKYQQHAGSQKCSCLFHVKHSFQFFVEHAYCSIITHTAEKSNINLLIFAGLSPQPA